MAGPLSDRLRRAAKAGRAVLLRGTRPANWLDLRRTEPLDRRFGLSRGTPVDRFYIERFLAAHEESVRGHVLEVGDARYTRSFGGARVTRSTVLHARPGNSEATVVGDLTEGIPGYEGAFDCLVLTQVLPFVFDVRAAVSTIRTVCAPGGCALVTVSGISQVSRYDLDRWGDYWRFTELSARLLFEEAFEGGLVDVVSYGNVLAAVALLHGIAAEELSEEELLVPDPDYPVTIGIVAHAPA